MTNTRGAEINQRFEAVNSRIDTLHAMMEELLARTKPPARETAQGGGQQQRVVTTNNMFSALEDVNDEDAEDAVIAETIDEGAALATNEEALAKSDGKNTQAGADATSKEQEYGLSRSTSKTLMSLDCGGRSSLYCRRPSRCVIRNGPIYRGRSRWSFERFGIRKCSVESNTRSPTW